MTLLDTDILIDASRGIEAAVACTKRIKRTDVLAVSVVSRMKLTVGCQNNGESQRSDSFLRQFEDAEAPCTRAIDEATKMPRLVFAPSSISKTISSVCG